MAVLFGDDALSAQTIEQLMAYIDGRKRDFCWGSNLHLWDTSLVRGSAAVLSHKLDAAAMHALFSELHARGKLPFVPTDAVMMFYAWLPGSYITWHSDYVDKHSMTIYLNREWDPNHGGGFCWRDWGDGLERHDWRAPPRDCRMLAPRFNAYVHMTDAEWHTVAMTTPNAPPRLSLQMFFGKPG
jgi:hypothetical protein